MYNMTVVNIGGDENSETTGMMHCSRTDKKAVKVNQAFGASKKVSLFMKLYHFSVINTCSLCHMCKIVYIIACVR